MMKDQIYVRYFGEGTLISTNANGEKTTYPVKNIRLQTDVSEKAVPPQEIDDTPVDLLTGSLRIAALKVQSTHGVRKLQRIIKPYQRPNSPWVALKHVPPENYKALLRTLTEATRIVPSDVHRLNELILRISQPLGSEAEPLVDRLIAAGDNLLSEHAQETDHFVIAIREYQAAIRELLK